MTLNMPEAITMRPWDVRRKLPVPFANTFEDGTHDFTTMNTYAVMACANGRLCGICGERVGYWIGFFGGDGAASVRTYNDPGMHVECVYAAMGLCPYILNSGMSRAIHGEESNLARSPHGKQSAQPGGWVDTHPTRWALLITRQYQLEIRRAKSGAQVPLFIPAPAKEIRYFVYDAGKLVPEK